MRVKLKLLDSKMEFKFDRDLEDNKIRDDKLTRNIMTDEKIYIKINRNISQNIHPDIIGLVAILLCNPFVGKKLELPLKVSSKFMKDVTSVISRYKIVSEVDHDLEPLIELEDGYPSLAFSGGADSCAALAIMPSRTIGIFLKRPMKKDSKYDHNAPLEICNLLKNAGFDIRIIESNLENIRSPTGFPTDLANSIPALLLSQELRLDSISFGTVLESAFGIGHQNYIEYSKGSHWRFYSKIFSAVGINLSLPVSGVSEVGTTMIGGVSSIASLSQSCIRGKHKKPCLRCWKCFRKELLIYSLGFKSMLNITSLMNTNEVQKRLSEIPISHENVILYSLQRMNLEDFQYLKPIFNKMDKKINLEFLEKWFPDSIEFVPKKYRFTIRENILKYLEPMNSVEIDKVKNWNMNSHLENRDTIKAQEELIKFWQNFNP